MEQKLDTKRSKTQRHVLGWVQDLDHIFWGDLEDLDLILGIIYDEQVLSEGGKSHLGLVV